MDDTMMDDLGRRLRDATTVELDADRTELHVASLRRAATADSAPTLTASWWRRRVVPLVATVSLLTPGLAVAAESSLPGEPLHPVKTAVERVRRVADPSVAARNRLEEVEALAARDEIEPVRLRSALAAAEDALSELRADAPALAEELQPRWEAHSTTVTERLLPESDEPSRPSEPAPDGPALPPAQSPSAPDAGDQGPDDTVRDDDRVEVEGDVERAEEEDGEPEGTTDPAAPDADDQPPGADEQGAPGSQDPTGGDAGAEDADGTDDPDTSGGSAASDADGGGDDPDAGDEPESGSGSGDEAEPDEGPDSGDGAGPGEEADPGEEGTSGDDAGSGDGTGSTDDDPAEPRGGDRDDGVHRKRLRALDRRRADDG